MPSAFDILPVHVQLAKARHARHASSRVDVNALVRLQLAGGRNHMQPPQRLAARVVVHRSVQEAARQHEADGQQAYDECLCDRCATLPLEPTTTNRSSNHSNDRAHTQAVAGSRTSTYIRSAPMAAIILSSGMT